MLAPLGKISFRNLLLFLVAVPLAGMIAFGGMLTWNAYLKTAQLSREQSLAELADGAVAMTLAIPAESNGSKEDTAALRTTTDAAVAKVNKAYTRVISEGFRDASLETIKKEFDTRVARIANFRQKLDDGTAEPLLSLQTMQPVVAVSSDLARRTGLLSSDTEVAGAVAGTYALMRLSDGYQMLNRLGKEFLKAGSLTPEQYGIVQRSDVQIATNTPAAREALSRDIMSSYDAFWQTAEGKMIEDTRQVMMKNGNVTASQADIAAWTKAHDDRRRYVSDLVGKAASEMIAMVGAKLSATQARFYTFFAAMACVLALVIAVAIATMLTLSKSIRRTATRMKSLAAGDTTTAVHDAERTDEIGEMARSVEIFRQAAIRNADLERQAEENRRTAERERIEVQKRAEEEAEARLNQATGSLAGGLRRLAAGDMSCEISEAFAPQFEALRHDFNTSVQQLREALMTVRQTAASVRGDSAEISSSSENLSKRTEQQAAALEETAAALEQITANVNATSERTGEAREVARDAKSRAIQSGQVVRDAVVAMSEIEKASGEIGKIIGVIDQIAFQTNLLALNAGVEAARAGDAGKGFAVVAQEVRELAQRSAEAAKQIKALITNSETAVVEGVRLVQDTGTGLGEIEKSVLLIHQHVEAIATAAKEQSVGLAEVNTAVNHMDQATQQNAAMVEEMSAAAAGLAGESDRLNDLLQRFQFEASTRALRETAAVMRAPARSLRATAATAPRPAAKAVAGSRTQTADWEEF